METLITDTLLLLYRAWYTLPLRATRAYLDESRATFAAALRDGQPNAAQAAADFFAAANLRPGVRALLEPYQKTIETTLAPDATLDAAAHTRLAQLAAAPDPFAEALARMSYQPSDVEPLLSYLWDIWSNPALPPADADEARRLLEKFETDLPAAAQIYVQRLALGEGTAAALEAIPSVRRLAWKQFLAAKVVRKEDVKDWRSGPAAMFHGGRDVPLTALDGAPAAGPAIATLYSDIHFPLAVKTSTPLWEPLIVRLTPTPQQGSVATEAMNLPFADPAKPELVDVIVTAPGFSERFNLWQRTIVVYSDQPSQPAVFFLRSDQPGKKEITVDFVHRSRHLTSARFATTVGPVASSARTSLLGTPPDFGDMAEVLAAPTPPVDLEMRIVRGNQSNSLSFVLHSSRSDVGYHWIGAGEVEFVAKDPAKFLEHKYERLSQLAADNLTGDAERSARAQKEIKRLGEELWDEVVPDLFKSRFWPEIQALHAAGKIKSLIITSDEPWIPWELVKPYSEEPVTGIPSEQPFWSETFQLTRWLSGRGSATRIGVQAARLIAPELDLAYVDEEVAAFDGLAARGIQIAPPLQTLLEVETLLYEGGAQLVHVAAHGSFNNENPQLSALTLTDGEIRSTAVVGSAAKGITRDRPLFFLNACSVGRLGLGLTGVGGWAEALIKTRVGAFIGTLWEVNDRLAAAFATHFYTRLFEGDTLGAAFHAARIHVRDLEPSNPTWLAYTLYGDPNTVVTSA